MLQIKEEKRPKFLLAENLGKLAKWLRFLGYDAALYRKISLDNMIRIANKDNRIILTRSKKVAKNKRKFKRILIKSENHSEQLRELKNIIRFDGNYIFSRCSECNRLLENIASEKIKNMIPVYIYQTQKKFKVCRFCGKIYWEGSHVKNMLAELKAIFPAKKQN